MSSATWKPAIPRRARHLHLLSAGAALVLTLSTAAHANPTWDRAANISEAADRLVSLHRAQGSRGVIKFLDACYKTHTLASAFNAALEACMAQDYMHARVLVEIYARLPDDARTRFNAPNAGSIAASVSGRFASVISQYALSQADADTLRSSIETHGLPIFLQSVLPQRGPAPGPDAAQGNRKDGKP